MHRCSRHIGPWFGTQVKQFWLSFEPSPQKHVSLRILTVYSEVTSVSLSMAKFSQASDIEVHLSKGIGLNSSMRKKWHHIHPLAEHWWRPHSGCEHNEGWVLYCSSCCSGLSQRAQIVISTACRLLSITDISEHLIVVTKLKISVL